MLDMGGRALSRGELPAQPFGRYKAPQLRARLARGVLDALRKAGVRRERPACRGARRRHVGCRACFFASVSLEICKLLYQTCVHVRPVIVMQVWQDLCFLDLAVPSDFSLHLGRGTGLTSTAFLRQRVLEGNKDFKSPKPETVTHVSAGACMRKLGSIVSSVKRWHVCRCRCQRSQMFTA